MKILKIVDIMTTGGYIERREYKKKTKYILLNRWKIRRARVSGEQISYLYERGVLKEEPVVTIYYPHCKYVSAIITIQNVRRLSKPKRFFRVAKSEEVVVEVKKSDVEDIDVALNRVLKRMGVDKSKAPHWMPQIRKTAGGFSVKDGYLCSYCGKKSWSKKEKCDGCNSVMVS